MRAPGTLASALRRTAGFRRCDVVSPEELAVALVGPVLRVELAGTRAMLFDVTGRPRIAVRPGLCAAETDFLIAHELGHYALRYVERVTMPIDEEEPRADRIGLALLAPGRRRGARRYTAANASGRA